MGKILVVGNGAGAHQRVSTCVPPSG